MTIGTATEGSATVLRPTGRIDSTTSAEFEAAVMRAMDGGAGRVVVSLGDVPYVSSAGLRVFLLGAKRSKEAGGRFVLCGMSETVRKVFQLAGFLRLMTVVDTETEALTLAG